MTNPLDSSFLDFLPPDFKVTFVARESRPTDLKDLLGKDASWHRLFKLWLTGTEHHAKSPQWFGDLVEEYDRHERYSRLALKKDQERMWNGWIKDFRRFCRRIRDHLEALEAQVEQDRRGVLAGTVTGGFSWLPADMRVRFVLDETRPKNLRELLKSEPRWHNLFHAWFAASFTDMADAFVRTRDWYYGNGSSYTRLVEEIGRAEEAEWNRVVAEFVRMCGLLREKITATIKNAPKRSKDDVTAEADARRAAAGARNRAENLDLKDVHGLIQVEALVRANTELLKPEIMRAYGAYRNAEGWTNHYLAAAAIGDAHTALGSAEARLGEAVRVLRGQDVKRVAGRDASQDPVPAVTPADHDRFEKAFEGYLTALLDVGKAASAAAGACDKWARSATATQLKENFASSSPVVNGCLLGLETLVWTMRICLVSAGLAGAVVFPIAPEATMALSSGISFAYTFIAETIKGLVSYKAAGDHQTIRDHLGAEYTAKLKKIDARQAAEEAGETPPGVADALAGAAGAGLPGAIDTIAKSLFATVKEDTTKMKIAVALPVVGEIFQGLALAGKWSEQLDPKELHVTEPEKRARLLTALDVAWHRLEADGEAVQGAITVHSYDPQTDTFSVELNGVPGLIKDGRFSPGNRSRSMSAVIAAFERNSGGLYQVEDFFVAEFDEFLGEAADPDDGTGQVFHFRVHVRAERDGRTWSAPARIAVSADGFAWLTERPHHWAVDLGDGCTLGPDPRAEDPRVLLDLMNNGLGQWIEDTLRPHLTQAVPLYLSPTRDDADGSVWRIHSEDESVDHPVTYDRV